MAFAQRYLDFRFVLSQGSYGDGSSDTVDLKGLRASANISRAGGNSQASAELRIWGVPLDVANKLTVLQILAYPELKPNTVIVSAGDEISGSSVVFEGTIQEAWVDAANAPDVMFHVAAFTSQFERLQPIAPTSYKGTVDASVALAGIAAQFGYALENNGVSAQLDNPYWPGDLGTQLQRICEAAHCGYDIDAANRVIAVWPKGGSRSAAAPILISKDTGLVGYPAFTEQGCRFTTLYNPSLVYRRPVEVKSDLTAANGTWTIANVSHNLDANVPGGRWFTEIECILAGHSLPIIGG